MNAVARTSVVVVAVFLSAHSTALRADNYVLDGHHTSIIFGINHLGYSFIYGRFNQAKGGFVWNNANPATGQFQLVIDAASIDTNDMKRDEHLRGPDFFNAKQFPGISFQSTSITPQQNAPGNFQLNGNLTIHGVTRQVTLPLRKLGEGDGPSGNYRCGFLCQTSIKRSDFGMTSMIPNIGDEVALTICFEGLRQGAPSASGTAGSSGAEAGSAPAARGGSGTQKGSSVKNNGSGAKQGSSGMKGSSGKR